MEYEYEYEYMESICFMLKCGRWPKCGFTLDILGIAGPSQ